MAIAVSADPRNSQLKFNIEGVRAGEVAIQRQRGGIKPVDLAE